MLTTRPLKPISWPYSYRLSCSSSAEVNSPLRVEGKAELEKTGDVYRRFTATNRGRARVRSPPNSYTRHTRHSSIRAPTPETKTTSQPQSYSELGISRVPIPVQTQIQRDVTSSRCGDIVPNVSNDRSSFTPQYSSCVKFLVVFLNPTARRSTTLHQLTNRSAKFCIATFILH
jgi:hypothetical protein